MNVVQVINGIVPGGAERLVQDLHARLLQRGHCSSLVAIAGDRMIHGEGGIWCAGCSSPYHRDVSRELSSLFLMEPLRSADLVHVHLFPALLRTPGALHRANWRGVRIGSEHSTSNRRRGTVWGRLVDVFTYRGYSKIVCVSEAVREALVRWKPSLRERAEVIHNGVELARFAPLAARTGFHDPPVILTAGRLTTAKNHAGALEAMALLSKRTGLDFVYVIAGDGDLKGSLERSDTARSLGDRVVFSGAFSDTAPLLRDADILFAPSLWEGFGLAAVEAMAAGLPLVAGDVPGLRDVTGSETALLVDPRSAEEMADALERLLTERDLALRLGSAGPGRAALYSMEACADAHLELYGRTLR